MTRKPRAPADDGFPEAVTRSPQDHKQPANYVPLVRRAWLYCERHGVNVALCKPKHTETET